MSMKMSLVYQYEYIVNRSPTLESSDNEKLSGERVTFVDYESKFKMYKQTTFYYTYTKKKKNTGLN